MLCLMGVSWLGWSLACAGFATAVGVAFARRRTARRLDDALRLARERSAELAHQTEMLHRVTGAIDECFYSYAISENGRVRTRFASEGWGAVLALPGDVGDAAVTWQLAVHPDDALAHDRARERVRGGEPTELEFRVVDANGNLRWLRARERRVGEEDGAVLVDGVVSDVSARRFAEGELAVAHAEAERLSRLDALTEIYNRRHFSEVLAHELGHPGRPLPAVLLIDLDRFKRVNDEHGQMAGDAVLQAAAGRIASILRRSDCLARWAGEEFAILAPDTDLEGALRLAERARRAIADRPVGALDGAIDLRVSVGVAVAGDGGLTSDALMNAAAAALDDAKRAGRDCVRAFERPAHDGVRPEFVHAQNQS
jgi:diguanylate cyclase (GGDEF)-like protein